MPRKKQHQLKKQRQRKSTGARKRFVFQEEKSFNCTACGVCCRQWTIYLTNAEIKRLNGVDWGSVDRNLQDVAVIREVVPPGEQDPKPSLARRDDGACVFLMDDGLCLVHKHLGFAAKPLPCRMFPFRLIGTPGGPAVGHSFYCPCVFDDDSRPFDDDALLSEALLSGRLPLAVESEVAVKEGWKIPWKLYRDVEEALDTILADEGCIIPVRLLAAHFFVTHHLSLFGEEFLNQEFPFRAMSEDALKMAGNKTGSAFIERMFRTPFLVYPESLKLLGVRSGMRDRVRYLVLLPFFLLAVGNPSTLTFPRGVPLGQVERVELDDTRFEHELSRFFRHVLFRKDLLVNGNLSRAVEIMVISWTLIRWYARTHACLAGRAAVEHEDIRDAVADVERLFLFHASTLTAPFTHDFYRSILRFLFSNDTFSAGLVL